MKRRGCGWLLFVPTLLLWASPQVVASAEPAQTPAAAYDFNGDGFADLAAPVPFEDIHRVEAAGAVQIVYGSKTGLHAAGNQLWSQASPGVKGRPGKDDWFGWSIASGDFDRDGFADLAAATQDGTVAVLFGSSSGLSNRDQLLTERVLGISFGSVVPRPLVAGDFDGDGFSDLVLAEPEDGGTISVTRGGPMGLIRTNRYLIRETDPGIGGVFNVDDYYGHKLAVGDVNGDGVDDLLATIENQNGSDDGSGEVAGLYVLPGSRTARVGATSRFIAWDDPRFLTSGERIAYNQLQLAVGDFDGDGFADVVAGIPYALPSGCGRCSGEVVVLPGGPEGPTVAGHQRWSQDSPGVAGVAERGDFFGEVLGTGDLNGDGRADLVIGSPQERVGRVKWAGAVHVLYGAADGLTATDAQMWTQASPQIKGTPRCADEFSLGGVTIGNFGKSRAADLAIRNPADGVGGTVNVLYGSPNALTGTDQLWHQDIPGMLSRARPGEGFGGGNFPGQCEVR